MHEGKMNWQEYGGGSDPHPIDSHDKGHGSYEDRAVRDDKKTKAPPAQPNPIK